MGKPTTKAVPQSEWIVVPDTIPAIITDEQFKRVREIMRANTTSKSDKPIGANLPFYRKILCGACGRSLTRSPSGGGYIYYCSTPKMKDGLGCMHGSVRENEVVETVLTVLRHQAQLADNVKSLKSANAKSSFTDKINLRSEVQNLQRLIEKANSTKLSLWENHHTGNISQQAFQKESHKLSEQVAAYTEKIAELETHIQKLELESGQENTFVERFSKQVGIQELSREVVDEFIRTIHIYAPGRIEIILNYADEYKLIQSQIGS